MARPQRARLDLSATYALARQRKIPAIKVAGEIGVPEPCLRRAAREALEAMR